MAAFADWAHSLILTGNSGAAVVWYGGESHSFHLHAITENGDIAPEAYEVVTRYYPADENQPHDATSAVNAMSGILHDVEKGEL